jgi:hypothetical protein
MSAFTPQEFMQTVWAFATAGVAYKVGVFCVGFTVTAHLLPSERSCKGCNLGARMRAAHSTTAAAVLSTTPAFFVQPMVAQACAVAGQLVGGLNPQGVATVLWALTSLMPGGSVPQGTLNALQDACVRVGVDRFRSVDMTVLVGALTRQSHIRAELAVLINRAIKRSLLTFSAENLCK